MTGCFGLALEPRYCARLTGAGRVNHGPFGQNKKWAERIVVLRAGTEDAARRDVGGLEAGLVAGSARAGHRRGHV